MNAAAAALSQPVICVVGPTASGKTDVAQLIATRLDGEVVSADSMQVYRGMDIGTGKLPESERLVPHYGFDLVNPRALVLRGIVSSVCAGKLRGNRI